MRDTLLNSFTREPLCTVVGPAVTCNATIAFNSSANPPGASFIPCYLASEYDARELSVYASTPTTVVYETLALRYAAGILSPQNIAKTTSLDARKVQLLDVKWLGSAGMSKPVLKSTCHQLSSMFQQQPKLFNFTTYQIQILNDATCSDEPSVLFSFCKDSTAILSSASECAGEDCYMVIACTIDARWAPISLWANTAVQTQISQSDPQPKRLFHSSALNSIKPITLTKSYLSAFLGPGIDGPSKIAALIDTWSPPLEGNVQQNFSPEIGGAQQNPFVATNYVQATA
ncbi:hypothetical protein DV736_g197, partial [Chaetothyriales sp. CBS 134916]